LGHLVGASLAPRRHLHPPPRKWGRGTTLHSRVVEGARASPVLLRRKRCVESDAPPPRFAWSPSPAIAGAEGERSRSRGALFVRARVFAAHHVANGFPACAVSWVFVCRPRPQTKGKRNAERRVVNTRALRARGALLRSALASRRPTAALARGTAGPQGSAPGHASGDSPERLVLYGRPNRGAETLYCSTGVTRAELIPVP
jgi:hypothetical protein